MIRPTCIPLTEDKLGLSSILYQEFVGCVHILAHEPKMSCLECLGVDLTWMLHHDCSQHFEKGEGCYSHLNSRTKFKGSFKEGYIFIIMAS